MAWATASLGDTAQGLSLVGQAEEAAPNDPYVHYYKALIKAQQGAESEALDALQRAVDLGYPTAMLAADPLLDELRSRSKFDQVISTDM